MEWLHLLESPGSEPTTAQETTPWFCHLGAEPPTFMVLPPNRARFPPRRGSATPHWHPADPLIHFKWKCEQCKSHMTLKYVQFNLTFNILPVFLTFTRECVFIAIFYSLILYSSAVNNISSYPATFAIRHALIIPAFCVTASLRIRSQVTMTPRSITLQQSKHKLVNSPEAVNHNFTVDTVWCISFQRQGTISVRKTLWP